MAHEFEFPDVGEGVTEGTLIKWLVAEGDTVEEDESLAEVETDKAIVEVPSPKTATILTLHAEEGDTIKVGEVLVTLGEEGEDAPAADEAEEEPAEEEGEAAAEEPAEEPDEAGEEPAAEEEEPADAEEPEPEEAETEAEEPGEDDAEEEPEHRESTSIVGELEEAPDEPAEAAEPEPEEAEEKPRQRQETEGRTLATPSTRRLAREKDVAIDTVKGTGPGGRVTKEDVERAAEGGPAPEEAGAPAEEPAAPEAAPAGRRFEPKEYDFAKWGEVERAPMSGTRKAIARAMERSAYTAPHVTHTDDADVTELWAVRKKEKHIAEEKGVHLTFLPFIVKACISALKDYPRMNSSLDEQAQELVRKDYYNIGVAVATDDGLLVPNVKHADEKSILSLGREMNDLAQQARDRELSLEQMRGGTFTITNYGSIGGRYGTPIINYPEVGILGVGTIRDEPVVKGESVKVRKILPLSLSFDHRVIDGAYAAQFMNEVISHLEDPDLLMIDE